MTARIIVLLVAQTTDTDTQAGLDELTRAVEGLRLDRHVPGPR